MDLPPITVRDLVARFVAAPDLQTTLSWFAIRCSDLPEVRAVALLLADDQNVLRVQAASSHPAVSLHDLEAQIFEGPSQDSYVAGKRIDCLDLSDADPRWPRYAPAAHRLGVRAIHAFPLRLSGRTLGALTFCLTTPGGFSDDDLDFGQFLADTAALGIAGNQATQAKSRADQLQGALDSRVLIEQAKGLLAERLGITPDEAFALLRNHARTNHLRLPAVCTAVLDGSLHLTLR